MSTVEVKVLTRSKLVRLSKWELFCVYTSHFDDEMSPLVWKGISKGGAIEMMLDGKDEVVAPWGGATIDQATGLEIAV